MGGDCFLRYSPAFFVATVFSLQLLALPQGGELRIPINLALLDAIRSDWWRETLFAYLVSS
jgi:hypothetical protein